MKDECDLTESVTYISFPLIFPYSCSGFIIMKEAIQIEF